MALIPQAPGGWRGTLAFASGLGFVFLQFALQGAFAMMSPAVGADLSLQGEQVALLVATFFVTYAGVQLPVGILLDRVGPAVVLPASCLAMGLGAHWLAGSTSFEEACVWRLWIGASSAFAFAGAVLLAERRMPQRWVPLCVGIVDAAMGIGCAVGTWIGAGAGAGCWRTTLSSIAWVAVPVTVLLVVGIGRTSARGVASIAEARGTSIMGSIAQLVRNPRIRALAITYFCSAGLIFGLAGYWNVPLQQAYGRTSELAGWFGTAFFVGLAIGSPLSGVLVGRSFSPLRLLVRGAATAAIACAIIVYVPRVNFLPVPIGFWALLGLSLGSSMLLFPLAIREAGPVAAATAVTLVNTAGLVGAGLFQFVPSAIMRLEPSMDELASVRWALSVEMIGAVVAWIVLIRLSRSMRRG